MMKRTVVGVAISIFQASAAIADFPSHADLCVEAFIKGKKVSIISKPKLAKAFVNQNPDWSKLFVNANEDASEQRFSTAVEKDFYGSQILRE
jgi:hypothetical protein